MDRHSEPPKDRERGDSGTLLHDRGAGAKSPATPLTNVNFTRNPEGAIYGIEKAMNNSYMNRIDNRTPVKGLYLASAWSKPGGGYTAVMSSGQATFAKLMEDSKLPLTLKSRKEDGWQVPFGEGDEKYNLDCGGPTGLRDACKYVPE